MKITFGLIYKYERVEIEKRKCWRCRRTESRSCTYLYELFITLSKVVLSPFAIAKKVEKKQLS